MIDRIFSASLLALALAGCAGLPDSRSASPATTAAATVPPATEAWVRRWNAPDPDQAHEQVRKAAAAMVDGIRRYDDGEFADAIAVLDQPEIRSAPFAMRLEALKVIAFSYCVTQHPDECRQAFDTALAIDPDFALGKGEGGHPMWGPVFEQAKAASERNRVRMTAAHARERWRNVDPWRPR